MSDYFKAMLDKIGAGSQYKEQEPPRKAEIGHVEAQEGAQQAEGKEKSIEAPKALKKARRRPTEPQERVLTLEEGARQQQAARDALKEYQKNIQLSEAIVDEITQEVKQGKDIYTLFLKAVYAIGCMTGNELLYQAIQEDVRAVYGEGLYKKAPLEEKLQDVTRQKERLEAASREAGLQEADRQRIIKALEAKDKEIKRLKKKIMEAEQITQEAAQDAQKATI
jgi:hypothetical protein